jgi:cytochrome c
MKSKAKCCKVDHKLIIAGILGLILVGILFKVEAIRYKMGKAAISQQQMEKTEVKDMKMLVDEAAKLVEAKGEKALMEFRIIGSQWRNGDRYMFAYDMNGNALLLPYQTELEGKNRLGMKDVKGKYFIKEMVDALKTEAAGWVEYYYPKPNSSMDTLKLSYFKKVKMGAKSILLGSGVYLD